MPWYLRLAAVILLLLTVSLAIQALNALPVHREALVAEKYGGWTGVLRLWVCEDILPGSDSLIPWLNHCAATFERAHPGVYVQAEPVDAAILRAIGAADVPLPDLILFPPGLLDSADDLLPLDPSALCVDLRAPLAESGKWRGELRAVPVAMSAYCWLYDRARLPALPDDWTQADARPSLREDAPFSCWSAAALCLCSGQRAIVEETEIPEALGLDLGLIEAPASPTPPAQQTIVRQCRLPADAIRDAAAFQRFLTGEAAAVPGAPADLRTLERLEADGRSPDWAAAMPGEYALADQLALAAVVRTDRSDREARAELAAGLIACLLSPASQEELARARAFPTAAKLSIYKGGDAMARLERALQDKRLLAPNAFANTWRADAAAALGHFCRGACSAEEALRSLELSGF